MPLILTEPETVKVDTVAITSFTVNVHPPGVTVSHSRGYMVGGAEKKFVTLSSTSATFDSDAIATVDKDGKLHAGMRAALYDLLQPIVSSGTVK